MSDHWRKQLDQLSALLQGRRLGLLTDMDGTLSPIVSNPDDAQLTSSNYKALIGLAGKLPLLAVISGREASDLAARVGIHGLVYIGNHGMERWDGQQAVPVAEAAQFREAFESFLPELRASLPGTFTIEDKGITVSIHYRNTPDPDRARTETLPVIKQLAETYGLSFSEGRRVFEVRPPLALDKGTALAELVSEYSLDAAIFLGDDVTDVTAFNALHTLRDAGTLAGLAVGVLGDETPPSVREKADLYASGVEDISALLGWLLRSVSASST